MSTRMVILGLLKERPLHGYEIKHLIEDHMGDWAPIAFGSIYFALAKLKDEGFVKISSEEKEGNRPSRIIYGITDKGRKEFGRLLRKLWEEPERKTYVFDLGLFFAEELTKEEQADLVKKQIASLENTFDRIAVHRKEITDNPDVPEAAEMIFVHSTIHIEAELTWLKHLHEKITKDVT